VTFDDKCLLIILNHNDAKKVKLGYIIVRSKA